MKTIATGLRIRAVSLNSSIWHVPMDTALEYIAESLPGTEELIYRVKIEYATFGILGVRSGINGTCAVLQCQKIYGSVPQSIKRFVEHQGHRESPLDRHSCLWEFYLNAPGDPDGFNRLRQELGREPTSDDLERLIIEHANRRWKE